MAKQTINNGAVAGDGTGESLYAAFTKVNANFSELYADLATFTGTGGLVRATNPTLVTPNIGTPSAGVLTNCTGLPVSTGIAGLGAGAATFLATPSSANLRAALTDETGTGAAVFATSPTLVTPNLGVATATSINGLSISAIDSTSINVGASAFLTTNSDGGNVALGANAFYDSTDYDPENDGMVKWSTAVGYRAGITSDSSNYTNVMCLGYNAQPSSAGTVSNEITLGNSSIATLRCQVTSITALSDARDKTDVVPLPSGLATIMALNPVRFTWNMRDGGKVGVKDSGFIAQDLQTVDDEYLRLVYAENPEKLEASYGRLIPVLVKAIQELQQQLNDLKK